MTVLFRRTHVLCFTLGIGALISVGCSEADVADDVASTSAAIATEAAGSSADDDHGSGFEAAAETEFALDWCMEHSVPESVCTQCNPALIAGFKETGDWCGGHGIPESHCRLCNPEIVFPQEIELRNRLAENSEQDVVVSLFHRPNAAVCATDGALIQFASSTTVDRAGISVQRAYSSHVEKTIDAPAEVVFDEAAKYVVSSSVPALISRWFVSPGDVVEKGAPLAILQSPDISKLKSDLINAQVNYQVESKELARHTEMQKRNLISEVDFDRQSATTEQARVTVASARGLLLSAGLSNNDIDEVIKHGETSYTFALTAPSSGVIAERKAQLGQLLEPGSAFAILADPASMWIEANLSEAQLRDIEVGQTLTFMSDGKGLNRVGAEVIWVSRFLDQHTRTGTVRARVLDAGHRLQAGEFGRVRILQSDEFDVTIIPKDAVQWEGCCNVVFVKETDQRYRPRKIQFIDGDGATYQVTNGVMAGEEVVVDGAFLLKTELKKSSIGAGCCEVEPAG